MKIQPITIATTNSNVATSNAQSFRGLWGDTDTDTYEDSTLSMTNRTMHYYPFKDESQSEINQVKKKYSDDNTNSPDSSSPMTFISTTAVSVMSVLPFTKQEFRDFMNNSLSSLKRKVIENHIMEKNLRI